MPSRRCRPTPPRGWTRWLAAVSVVLAVVLGPAGTASAHAQLVATNPTDGSLVRSAPSVVTLDFSEDVQVRGDGVRVLDARGRRVDRGAASASGGRVQVPLRPLERGSYLVSFRVVSADGHPVLGAFTFSVGVRTTLESGLAGSAFSGDADRPWQIAGGVLRTLAYLGGLGAGGAVLVGAGLRRKGEPTPVGRTTTMAAAVGLVGVLGQLPVQAALATGQGIGSIIQPGVFGLSLSEGMGWSTLVCGLGLLAVVLTANLPFVGPARKVALVGAVLIPIGFVVSGHSRTMSPALVALVADLAHVVAGGLWFGGLIALVAVVHRRRTRRDDRGAADAVVRFSGWAALVLLAVVLTGGAMGWIEVGGLHALVSTTYGRVLLVKVGVVGVIALAAGWNRFRLLPAIERVDDDPTGPEGVGEEAGDEADAGTQVAPQIGTVAGDDRTWNALLRIIRFELAAMAVVLALTGALVNITPARNAVQDGPVSTSATLGDGTVQVVIDPARVGSNDIHAYLLDKDGRPDRRFRTAQFALALPARKLGPIERTPVSAGGGHFLLVNTDLTPGGTWTLTITVKPDKFTVQRATVTFEVR